jgi:hypothetical protein
MLKQLQIVVLNVMYVALKIVRGLYQKVDVLTVAITFLVLVAIKYIVQII